MLPNLWRDPPTDPVDALVYRSNLLGSDPRITNFGGGNTSSKIEMPDPLTGEPTTVLWVKGSGGDLGSMKRAGLASLYLDKVLALESKYKSGTHEDDIVPLYPFCTFGLNPTAASIDTPLHAFVPYAHVDHMHADALIAVAAAENGEQWTKEIFGDEIGWLPWKRPGFELGLMLRDLIAANPGIVGAVMGSHGFISWADTQEECYATTLRLINKAQAFLDLRTPSQTPVGEGAGGGVSEGARTLSFVDLLPELRGGTSYNDLTTIAHVDQSDAVMEFLASPKMEELAALGTSCPDHFLRTKVSPMILRSKEAISSALAAYRVGYQAYYDQCKRPDSPAIRNPNPSVVLIPGLGMATFGKTKREAAITAEFYRRAIEVMKGAESLSRYTALPAQEAFDIEYWLLEEAKLKRMPPPQEFSGKVALITGAAQGIGLASAQRLKADGACVVLVDRDGEKLKEAEEALNDPWNVKTVVCDVTTELNRAFEEAILAFGGVDIVVANAGSARRGSIQETTDEDFEFLTKLLVDAYFRTLRLGAQTLIRQGTGGSLIVIGSKNAVAIGSNAAAYNAAKAYELHLMRSAAVDLAPHGIRANAVNPDAVIQGSGIWSDAWREQTAKNLGIASDEIGEHYRKRSMLGRTVEPSHIAEAVAWLASERRSGRTTGATIPVDAGVREGFLR